MKEEEEIDMSVYDRLYKVEVYTGEAGISANVSKYILFIETDVTLRCKLSCMNYLPLLKLHTIVCAMEW